MLPAGPFIRHNSHLQGLELYFWLGNLGSSGYLGDWNGQELRQPSGVNGARDVQGL